MTTNKIHWSKVEFEGEDGSTFVQSEPEYQAKLLREYRATGSIVGHFLAPLAGQESGWEAGPTVDQIDWTGIDEVSA